MKVNDLETILDSVNKIKDIINKENYSLSSNINKQLIRITPLVEKELDRKSIDEVEFDCPRIKLLQFNSEDLLKEDYEGSFIQMVESQTNIAMANLVRNEYKIIDCNMKFNSNGSGISCIIKYTT